MKISILLTLLATSALASVNYPAEKQTHPVVIRGATIHPVSAPEIADGVLVFDQGKIVALGNNVPIPDGAEVIEAKGKHVYPGLIAANSALGLIEISAVRSTVDLQEAGAINPNARAYTSINPDSELLPVARSNGILTSLTVPESDLLCGQSVLMRLDGWTPEEMAIKPSAAMHVRWPNLEVNRDPRAPRSVEDQQKEIEKEQRKIREAFQNARAYWQARKVATESFKVDPRWEAMQPMFEGKLPLFIHASSIGQMEAALAFAKEMQLKIVLVGGDDAWRMTERLKETDTPVVIALTTALPPRRDDPYDSQYANAAKLHEAGVRFCIARKGRQSEAPHERSLPFEAGMAAAYGLPKEEALKAVTLYPAQILGVADQLGSLEAGRAATLLITTGDLLDFPTQVDAAYIDGRKLDLSNRQTRLRDKYQEKYRRK